MIAIIKQSHRTFHGAVLSDSAIRTAVAEIAAVLNARPLTYVSEDNEDIPLTPNDLLLAQFSLPSEIKPPADATVTASHVIHIWKQSKQAVDTFWTIWRSSYLQSLRRDKRAYSFPQNTTKEQPRVGHVVLIAEKNIKRPSWKLGRILQLNVSEDGEIRSATLRVGTRMPGLKMTKPEVITRPMHYLYPLELPEEEVERPIRSVIQNSPTKAQTSSGETEEEIVIEVDTGIEF